MCSPNSLRHWVQAILPNASCCAHAAAFQLLRALLVGFNTQLSQLARQADRDTSARVARQFFARWFNRDHWQPKEIYIHLNRLTQRVLKRLLKEHKQLLILVDATDLSNRWVVLQASTPWQRRALPLYRVVYPYSGVQRDQVSALAKMLEWLEENLPGSRDRYILVMDRGFPSKQLVTELRRSGWRFVLRVKSNWRMEHARYCGQMRGAVKVGLVGETPEFFADALLGYGNRGAGRRGQAHVVFFHGAGHQEPWYLVTSERDAAAAVAVYRQRMCIEQEFRDLKGPLGLDLLSNWWDCDRVARLLAWVAVYEWRLAYLWDKHDLASFRSRIQIYGALSWIRTVREWITHQFRKRAGPAPACL
jgi:hypothetical protein